MCMVVDANLLRTFFYPKDKNHDHYSTLLNWLISGKIKMTLGGTKYSQEFDTIRQLEFVRIIRFLKDKRSIVEMDKETVDQRQAEYEKMGLPKDFDDPHIAALALTSRAKLLCTNDQPLIKYIKLKKLRANDEVPPKIYGSSSRKTSLNLSVFKKPCLLCRRSA